MDIRNSATKPLKIIEGLKELKLVRQRIQKNNEIVQQYAALASNEKSPFEGGELQQRKVVAAALQSNEDLVVEAMILKMRIDNTNLSVGVEINGSKYTISQLLMIYQDKLGGFAKQMLASYACLNTNAVTMRLSRSSVQPGVEPPQPVPMYKEEDKNAALKRWQELRDLISGKLEVINATTDLLPLPEASIAILTS